MQSLPTEKSTTSQGENNPDNTEYPPSLYHEFTVRIGKPLIFL